MLLTRAGFCMMTGIIMRNVPRRLAVVFLITLAIGVSLYYSVVRAQSPSLQDQVARLKADVDHIPTDASNYHERVALLEHWGDDLAVRGRLPNAQDLMSAFYRLPDPDATAQATVKRWVQELSFLEEHGGKLGTLVRTDKNDVVAGKYTTVIFEYTVGDYDIPQGQGLRIGQKFISNRPRLQVTDPQLESWVTFKVTSSTAKTQPYPALWQGVFSNIFGPTPMPGLRITSGRLAKGDKVVITIGDTSRFSQGWRPMPRDADDYQFLIEADIDGQGDFVPAAITSIQISGDDIAQINAIAPSIVKAGEPFALRLRVEDQNWNPARFQGGAFQVSLSGKPAGEIRVPAGESVGRIDGLKIAQPGGYKLEVKSTDGRFSCLSNPVLVEANPRQRIYWGELHAHSGWEEGTGSVPHFYHFARDIAFLDFASLTGHDLFLAKPGWDQIRAETAKANRDGSFVAFMGYEWTQTYDKGGHHNIFFKQDKGRYVQYREAPHPDQLYKRLREVDDPDNVLIIPHAHEAGDWHYTDAEMQRLVEIYSGHGSFEYFGQKFLKRGYRMGVVAASDDHSGHPGYAPALVSTRGGLAAVYSPALNRDGIWNGLKSRATYATSGKRPVIKMSIGDKLVGESAPVGAIPAINARVLGTAAIDHVDVMHNGEQEYSRDFLTPNAGESSGVQIMFFSPTETPGDKVMPPDGAVYWGGWIEVSGGRIRSIEGLGLDTITDVFHQVDDRRLWFWCKTRGDFDGVFLRLSDAPADTKISVRISDLVFDPGGTGAGRGVYYPSGVPSTTVLHEVNFKVEDVAASKGKWDVAPRATVFARKARLNGPWDVSFTYRPTKTPVQDDYYYLRIVQIDGEAAWSSPIWIGEETSPRRK